MGGDDSDIQGLSLAVELMGDASLFSDSSPLQIFVEAKKKINDIFVEIEDYVRDAVTYMQSKYKGELTWIGQDKLEFQFSDIFVALC